MSKKSRRPGRRDRKRRSLPYAELQRIVGGVDPLDLAAGTAALQLLPENADRLLRLEASAALAAALVPALHQRAATRQDLEAVVNQSVLAAAPFSMLEDAHEGLFTDTVPFDGGAYTVFPGIDRATSFNFRALAGGLFGGPAYPDEDFAQLARIALWAGLRVADAVARRAGLRRGIAPVHSDDRSVVLPEASELARLKSAVRFTTEEMTATLAGNPPIVLGRLLSTFDTPLTDPADPALRAHPILVWAGEYVVAAPHELVMAAIHTVLGLAAEQGQAEVLGKRVRAAVNRRVAEALERMRIRPRLAGDSWNAVAGPLASIWELDTDKRLSLFTIADDLEGYQTATPFADWERADVLVDVAGKREREIEAAVCSHQPIPNAIFHLYVIQSFRPYSAGLDPPTPPLEATRLMLPAADLELLSYLEHGEPLALLKFARASEELRRRTRVISHDILAEYAVYRGSHSFYFDDAALPNGIGFDLGGISQLYSEVARKVDLHGALLPGEGGWIEVVRLQQDTDFPVYGPTRVLDEFIRSYVDRGPGYWLTASVAGASERGFNLAVTAAESIGYWIWQIYPWIAKATALGAAGQDPIEVRLVLPGEGWFNETTEAVRLPESRLVDGRVEIVLDPSFRPALMRPDNSGEREIVRALARGLQDLAAARGGGAAPEDRASVDACVDEYAPLGMKKHLLQSDARQNLALFTEDLPTLRLLQDADDAVVLDALGPAIAQANALPIGPVPAEKRLTVLGSAVSWALEELGRALAALSPEALPWFVGHYERLIQAQAQDRLRAPAQIACFGDTPAVRERINRKADDYVHTALALRIVIEHLAARPPQGIRPMSMEVHDRALALANEALKRAYAYDGIKYGLHDLKVSILPSGRLGMSRGGAMETARARFAPIYAAAEVERSVKSFAKHWDSDPSEATRAALAELDPAATQEFGFSITELATFLAETGALGLDLPGTAKVIALDEFIATMSDRLGWLGERVAQAVDFFALRPREGFLKAPPGYKEYDVFPWRFNRQLSYARRPLIIRTTSDGQQVVFGMREVVESAEYFYELCTSARFRGARTRAMQQAISSIRDRQTDAFVEEVADHFRAMAGTVVDTEVGKIAGHLIGRSPAEPLGDIDVLVAWPGEHRILSIEVKDLAVARTPIELDRQLEAIFVTRAGRPARAAIHVERTEYLRAHLLELLADMQIADDGRAWTVEPLMVTSRELLTHHLAESPVPVISFPELTRKRGSRWSSDTVTRSR